MARTNLRSASWMLPLLLTMSLGSAQAVADDPVAAIPVSPGDSQAGALIGDPCPSFSWGAVDGAQRYELAIFDAQWDDSPGYEDQQRLGVALRRIEIDAPALSWTPAGSECLDEGGSYLWFVRAETAAGEEVSWSAPRYFAIDYDSDALTQTVRRELTAQLRRPEVWREVIQSALSSNGRLALSLVALGAVAPASEADATAAIGAEHGEPGSVTEPAFGALATTFPNPSALKVNSPNGVVFNQSATTGDIPAEGAGTRFMWYPRRGVLRAGTVMGSQWDKGNIGLYSMAIGYNTTASGGSSTAMGDSTTASGTYSTAMGYNTTASGEYSTAMGGGTTASGNISTAMGGNTTASGNHSTAMGWYTTASGFASTAMGGGTIAKSKYEMAIGSHNTNYYPLSPMDWNATDRLFVIGNGTGSSTRSDALVMLKNGNTTLNGQLAISGAMTQASSGNTPNLKLGQGSVNDFARLRLAVVDEPDFWDVAAGGSDNVFNIWLQGSGNLLTLHSSGDNLMSMKNGARLTTGGTWTNASDRALKSGFQPVDTGAILAQVVELPLSQWSYLREPGVRHIGPVAQDFHAAFGLGDSDTAIATVDADGVALAAIQGLHRKLETVAAAQAATANDLKQQTHEVRAQHQAAQAQQEAQQEQISAQQDLIAELKTQNQSQQDLLQTQQAQIAALHKDNTALAQQLSVQESQTARLVSERAEEMALIRSELQRLGEQVSAQPSMQRTAVLP